MRDVRAAPAPAVVASYDPGPTAGVAAIWVRELRGRMRGKRAFIFISFYLGLLTAILWLALRTTESIPSLSIVQAMGIGRGIFAGVLLIDTLLVVALAAAYTAATITSEREKQTYELLAVTPVSSLSIVVGKLLSGLSYLALIVLASVPVASTAFMFGGIEPIDIVRGYIVLVAAGLGIGAIGVWCSAAMARSQTATVAAFVIVAGLVVGASAAWLTLDSRYQGETSARPPLALLVLNPFIAQLDVICQGTGEACLAQQSATLRAENLPITQQDPTTGLPRTDVFGAPPAPGDFWPKTVLLYGLIAILGIYGASQSISPTRRWRWRPVRRSRSSPVTEATDD